MPGCKPVIGRGFVDQFCGVAHDSPQNEIEVFLRVDAEVATGLDQGKDGGAGLAAVL